MEQGSMVIDCVFEFMGRRRVVAWQSKTLECSAQVKERRVR